MEKLILTWGDLSRATQKLSSGDRIDLVHILLQSLEGEEDSEYERLWLEEAERRYREFQEGRTELFTAEEVIAQLRAELLASAPREPEIREEIVMAPDEVKREALNLPGDERLDLAFAILRDLEDEGFEVDWDKLEVIGRREQSPGAQ